MSEAEKVRVVEQIRTLRERLASLCLQSGPIAEVGQAAVRERIMLLGRRLLTAAR